MSLVDISAYIRPGSYAELVASANSLPVRRFAVAAGMGFGDTLKWWAQGARPSAHNGIDLLGYESTDSAAASLETGTLVPLIAEGTVLGIIPDYMAKSIIAVHALIDGMRLISLYGHIEPLEGIRPGERLSRGALIGRIAQSTRGPVPGHLHLSLALVAEGIDEITWEVLDERGAHFIDPLPYL